MYNLDDIVKCEVTGLSPYGIFVKTKDDYIGLVHISEVSDGFVKDISQFAQVGDYIYCRIIEIDDNEKQLKLSIKHIDYKKNGEPIGVMESRRGFKPLKEQLPIWTDEKIQEYNEEQE